MFEVAAVFSDHCVLQREKNICVFGWSDEQGRVFAELFDKNGMSLGYHDGNPLTAFKKLIIKSIF